MFHLSSGIKDALSRVGSKEHFNIGKFIGLFSHNSGAKNQRKKGTSMFSCLLPGELKMAEETEVWERKMVVSTVHFHWSMFQAFVKGNRRCQQGLQIGTQGAPVVNYATIRRCGSNVTEPSKSARHSVLILTIPLRKRFSLNIHDISCVSY